MLAKRFLRRFLRGENSSSTLKNQHPVVSGEILSRLEDPKTGRLEQARYVVFLRVAYLDRHPSGCIEKCFRLSCNRPVCIEPVRAAIQGSRRIEIPDLALQGLKLLR